jgi:riboflavin kinase / FMN adenylyltransferase
MKTWVINDHQIPKECEAFVACIGFFDGLHIGHQALIEKTNQLAKDQGLKSAMITFFPHPSSVLQHKQVMYLTPHYLKQQLLESYGLDYLIIVNFTVDFSKQSGDSFIENILCQLPLRHLVVGFDFRFGYQGKGDVHLLTQSQTCFEVSVIEQISDHHNKISSTLIKSLISEGNVALAHQYLSRPHQVRGQVIQGNQRGRTIGFPTANIDVYDDVIIPAPGVYIAQVTHNQITYASMVNIGHNPTFNAKHDVSIEAFILDFNETIYGQTLVVHFLERIRDEKKFNSIQELIDQLHLDNQKTRDYFKM